MVAVCLTVIGLIRVVITLGTADTLADDMDTNVLLKVVVCIAFRLRFSFHAAIT